ncbi:hypothetical protein [Billgrantia endophytica]|uniref:Lipoprotein n=1 Tax=Billgrantia endophytica TaxID=2033802 RepID=A0A2N7U351_9GAMM|nr:hypothetical protein [Halomonas endophytica]PMR74857.1 hypothetical protein C1H69_11985 [Halomonas endophytica]
MKLHYALPLLMATALVAGCGSNAIVPSYTSEDPDIMHIGDDRPADPETTVENLGSYCVEVTETWNAHGTTPDGQSLWAKDTSRAVVPCD